MKYIFWLCRSYRSPQQVSSHPTTCSKRCKHLYALHMNIIFLWFWPWFWPSMVSVDFSKNNSRKVNIETDVIGNNKLGNFLGCFNLLQPCRKTNCQVKQNAYRLPCTVIDYGLVIFTEEILNGKIHFLCSVEIISGKFQIIRSFLNRVIAKKLP